MNTRTTCYFFFKDDNDIQKNANTALSALLHQLFSQKPILIKHAMSDYAADGDKLPQSFYKLWGILIKAIADPNAGVVVCVLDALDECVESERYQIIDALKTFFTQAASGQNISQLKFLVTSRPYFDIERRFTDLIRGFPTIRLHGEKELEIISREIDVVIKWKVEKLGLELELDKREQSTLEHELLGMQHRTYLWLKLIFEVIQNEIGLTKTKLKRIIDTLPATVDHAYEAILSKSKDQIRARKLLHIIVAATRPLTLKEMNVALAIEDYHRCYDNLDLEKEATFGSTIRNLCGLFVTVVDQKGYLIHQTAKEFLIAESEVLIGRWKHSLNPVESDLLLATICITYLNFIDFDEESSSQTTEQYNFFNYAACFWATHSRQAQSRANMELLQSVLNICKTQTPRFLIWFRTYRKYWLAGYPEPSAPEFTEILMVESYFGHETAVKLLLETSKAEVNLKDNCGRTSLWWAAENGYEDVVRLLLAPGGVDVDSKDNELNQTPLWRAINNGNVAVVKLLLETGEVDVNLKDIEFNQTPLSWAARIGDEAVVKLLLETDKVEINSKDSIGQTPLSSAASNGHEAVVRLLLETGKVEVDSEDKTDYMRRWWEVQKRKKHLRKTGKVDVNWKEIDHGRTALSLAAGNGHKAVVKLLLMTSNAKVDSIGGYYCRTAPSFAAENGHDAVLKLLLNTGKADSDSTDYHDRTPLSWAAANGHKAVVKLLLATGKVEVASRDSSGRIPISYAAEKGHEAVFKLLLEMER